MKAFLIATFALLFITSPASKAWKEVGNAAGISEQNIIYAMQNGEGLLSQAGKILTSASDKFFLAEFITALKNSDLDFNYDKNQQRVFSVQGNNWLIYSENLLKYDQDGNGILSLKESFHLLFELFSASKNYSSDEFNSFVENILSILAYSEKTLLLKAYGEELQWTELSGGYYLFYSDFKPLLLTGNVLESRMCDEGSLLDFQMHNPFLIAVQKRAHEIRLVVSADAYFQCIGESGAKKIFLDLVVTDKEAQLKLR